MDQSERAVPQSTSRSTLVLPCVLQVVNGSADTILQVRAPLNCTIGVPWLGTVLFVQNEARLEVVCHLQVCQMKDRHDRQP